MYDVSYPGVICWSKCIMEKLGFMILAHSNGDTDSVHSYVSSIEKLIHIIDENMKEEELSFDRKKDYEIMYKNLDTLLIYCNSIFYEENNAVNLSNENENENPQKGGKKKKLPKNSSKKTQKKL